MALLLQFLREARTASGELDLLPLPGTDMRAGPSDRPRRPNLLPPGDWPVGAITGAIAGAGNKRDPQVRAMERTGTSD